MNPVAYFLSQLPRFNFSFREISISNGFSHDYLQAIVVWSCLPLLVCLFLLAIILIVWSSKCCSPKSQPKRRCQGTPRCLLILIVISCLCLATSLVANECINRGAQSVTLASNFLQRQSHDAIRKVHNINQTLFVNVSENLKKLQSNLEGLSESQKQFLGTSQSINRISETKLALTNASVSLEVVLSVIEDFKHLLSFGRTVDRYEFERWILFGSLLTIVLVVMLSSITIISLHSKKGTVLFGAIGIFMLIICWTIVGASVAVTLILADFCTNSNAFLTTNLISPQSKAQLQYYSNCSSVLREPSPLNVHLKFAENSLAQIPPIINEVSGFLFPISSKKSPPVVNIEQFPDDIHEELSVLLLNFGALEDMTSCRMVAVERESLNNNLCFWSMYGSVVIVCTTFVFATILFFVLVFLKRAWRSFIDVNDDAAASTTYSCGDHDPFLVTAEQTSIPADFYGSHVSNPRTRLGPSRIAADPFKFSENISTTSGQERGNSSPVWRSTPPPAYESVPLLRAQVRQQRM